MYKYVAIAILASALVFAANVVEKRCSRKVALPATVCLYALSAIVFCFFAGARGINVGTDVLVYGQDSFDSATTTSFPEFFLAGSYSQWMPFAKAFLWVIANVFHSFFWYQFLIEAVVVVPVLVALRLILKEKAYLGVLIFGMVFFPMSLNLMRQFMGMGFVFLSFQFVEKRKPLSFCVLIGVATLFHDASILGLLIYPLYLIGAGTLKICDLRPSVIAVVLFAVLLLSFGLIRGIAPFTGRFQTYLTGAIAQGGGAGSNFIVLLIIVTLVLGLTYTYYRYREDHKTVPNPSLSGLSMIVFFGIIAFSMCLLTNHMFRLGVFFLYFAILLVPMASANLRPRKLRIEFLLLSIALLALFGDYYYGTCGNHAVVPYAFAQGLNWW